MPENDEFLRTAVFNEAMRAMREQFQQVRDSLSKSEALLQQTSANRMKDVYEEGVRTGRIQALENRMDRHDSWIKGLAVTLAGAVMAWFLGMHK